MRILTMSPTSITLIYTGSRTCHRIKTNTSIQRNTVTIMKRWLSVTFWNYTVLKLVLKTLSCHYLYIVTILYVTFFLTFVSFSYLFSLFSSFSTPFSFSYTFLSFPYHYYSLKSIWPLSRQIIKHVRFNIFIIPVLFTQKCKYSAVNTISFSMEQSSLIFINLTFILYIVIYCDILLYIYLNIIESIRP